MKKFLLIILVLFCSYSLEAYNVNKNEFVQKGVFSCKTNGLILFFETNSAGEETPRYNLKAIDLRTNKQIRIANNLSCENCLKITDDVIAYTDGKKIISYNLKSKEKYNLLQSDVGCYITGIGIDATGNKLLEIQVDYKRYQSLVKVINTKTKVTLFQQKIKLDENEMEGIMSLIQTTDGFFIFSLQNKLFYIPINSKPELKLISDKYDEYAINNTGMIFYKFVTDETTEGYYLNFHNLVTNKIDPSLNKKISNCEKSFLITATHQNNLVPYYIICGIPYVFSNYQWKVETNVLIYYDQQVEIRLNRLGNNKIDESKFAYKLLN